MKHKKMATYIHFALFWCLFLFFMSCGNSSQSGNVSDADSSDDVDMTESCDNEHLSGNARITFNLEKSQRTVNRLLLGNNAQWVDGGDEILKKNSLDFDVSALDMLQKLSPTVIRYPGGSFADAYHWRNGMGTLAERGECEHVFARTMQKVYFGTKEFLTLCRTLKATPLITINVITETPQDAADWVKQINVTGILDNDGNKFPPVKYWEIGNEPYLKQDYNPDLDITPSEFAKRSSAIIAAMRKVDPTIVVGLPLRLDTLGNVAATPYPGFSDTVLQNVSTSFDFVAIHNAYRPVIFPGPDPDDIALFKATMASTLSVQKDFDKMQKLLHRFFPQKNIPLALTEYNTFFTQGKEPTDSYITSLMGALYVADLIRIMSERDDILMANYWSLKNNFYFGSISFKNTPRVPFLVLSMFSEKLKGKWVPFKIDSPAFNSQTVGYAPETHDVPTITAMVVRDSNTVRFFLLNKDVANSHSVDITEEHCHSIKTISLKTLTSDHFLDGHERNFGLPETEVKWRDSSIQATAFPLTVTLPQHSLSLLEIELGL